MGDNMYKVSYVADGITTEYDFVFPFFQAADVRVSINGQDLPETEYSVLENPDFDGGRIAFAVPLAPDTCIDIYRQISLSRVVDYQPTEKIDPEHLNSDFNFLLEAFKDLRAPDIDLGQWRNTHSKIVELLEHTNAVIEDKLSGGSVLGLYRNLVSVLDNALPQLINDYGQIDEPAPNETKDDYGVL